VTEPTRDHGYQAIVQRIRLEIARGERAPGERLPSVRSLARSLSVNANTVARAYAELARDGSIESRGGGGTFVRATTGDTLLAERRSEQLRAIMAEAVLRSLSLGYSPDEIERAVGIQLDTWQSASTRSVKARPGDVQALSIHFAGSHDLALELLATRLRHHTPPVDLQLNFIGSMAGLLALLLDQAEIAGCHLGGEEEDALSQVSRMLPGRPVMLVTLGRREQGLMLPPGNPRDITAVGDLTKRGVRIALRQAGSGTRILLDRALAAEGVRPSFEGHPVLATHGEVAAAIADGSADAGLGILAAARTYGLDFVPLTWERYDLVIPTELTVQPAVSALLKTLRSPEFKSAMEALGGYETRETGRQISIP
jgi:molybdate-binding protein/DNA-binding transcriptional regulator YhcF (GntR family)